MGLIQLFILAVGLSMDAFAVAICKGLSMKKITIKKAGIVGLYFGAFQAGMPLIGYFLGIQFRDKIKVLENATYIVEDFFPEDEGLKKFILSFGNNCEVIAPSKLRKEMSEYIKDIYSKYNYWYLNVSNYYIDSIDIIL